MRQSNNARRTAKETTIAMPASSTMVSVSVGRAFRPRQSQKLNAIFLAMVCPSALIFIRALEL